MSDDASDNRPKCESCGIPWRDHLGPTSLCRRINELTAQLADRDAALLAMDERWRLMGEHLHEAAGCKPFYLPENTRMSSQWARGYSFAATIARGRYNELTPSSGAAAEE